MVGLMLLLRCSKNDLLFVADGLVVVVVGFGDSMDCIEARQLVLQDGLLVRRICNEPLGLL